MYINSVKWVSCKTQIHCSEIFLNPKFYFLHSFTHDKQLTYKTSEITLLVRNNRM